MRLFPLTLQKQRMEGKRKGGLLFVWFWDLLDFRIHVFVVLFFIRSLQVCLELNLSDGVSHHEKLAVNKINEDQQAR